MIEVLWVLIITSVALAIPGLFLVLRNMSMVADALSHTVILGIVLAYFITKDLNSPLLVIGASLFGLLTVYGIEWLISGKRLRPDAATGIVFPLFFSIGVILISKFASKAHLDVDCVLMGEVIFTPFNRIELFGFSIPYAIFQMGIILIANLLFVLIFYKELKLVCFDYEAAIMMGFSVTALHYGLTALVSLSAVAAFDAIGAILVIAFLVIPAASALLISKRLSVALFLTIVYAVVNSVAGYFLALHLNVSMPGMCAAVAGVTYFITFLLNRRGLITRLLSRRSNRNRFRNELMLLHIQNHSGQEDEFEELSVATIASHLNWSEARRRYHGQKLLDAGLVTVCGDQYCLTDKGNAEANRIQKEYGIF